MDQIYYTLIGTLGEFLDYLERKSSPPGPPSANPKKEHHEVLSSFLTDILYTKGRALSDAMVTAAAKFKAQKANPTPKNVGAWKASLGKSALAREQFDGAIKTAATDFLAVVAAIKDNYPDLDPGLRKYFTALHKTIKNMSPFSGGGEGNNKYASSLVSSSSS